MIDPVHVYTHRRLGSVSRARLAHAPQEEHRRTLVLIGKTDLLVLPVQWAHSRLWSDELETIPVKEVLPAPAINIVRRSALPLTPAAEYFCDMIRRVSANLPV